MRDRVGWRRYVRIEAVQEFRVLEQTDGLIGGSGRIVDRGLRRDECLAAAGR